MPNQDLINERRNELLKLPLNWWSKQINDWSSNNLGRRKQNGSIKAYYDELMEQNWRLGKINANKLAKTPREVMAGAIAQFEVKPDNLQIAVGSYAAYML